jgi:hypothetical protein
MAEKKQPEQRDEKRPVELEDRELEKVAGGGKKLSDKLGDVETRGGY